MFRDLDDTLEELLTTRAPAGSELSGADISFELPDTDWRGGLETLTVNCYLYDIHENLELKTAEPPVQRSLDGTRAVRRRPPVRIDCAYCITAWSPATNESVLEEHRLLGQILRILLLNPTLPADVLQGSLADQLPPYPTLIAAPDGVKNQPEFWGALDQQLKPSLNYVLTLAVSLDESPLEAAMPPVVERVEIVEVDLPEGGGEE